MRCLDHGEDQGSLPPPTHPANTQGRTPSSPPSGALGAGGAGVQRDSSSSPRAVGDGRQETTDAAPGEGATREKQAAKGVSQAGGRTAFWGLHRAHRMVGGVCQAPPTLRHTPIPEV